MGVTIHYSGKAKNKAAVDRIMHTVMLSASQWDWPTAIMEDPDGEIVRTLREPGEPDGPPEFDSAGIDIVNADDPEASGVEVYEGPVSMLSTQPGEGCEAFRLSFDRHHRMDGFVKTQYGPVEAHVRICRLLRAIERHFEVLEVIDESGFYESDDLAALEERIGSHASDPEAAIARYEAAKRRKELDDMYKIDGDDSDDQ